MSTETLLGTDEMRQAVQQVLNDFSRRVRQAHSYDEIDAHRDELADLLVQIVTRRSQPKYSTAPNEELSHAR